MCVCSDVAECHRRVLAEEVRRRLPGTNVVHLFPVSDPVVETLGEALTPYLAGKGTIRFPASKPIPSGLVTEIARICCGENAAHRRR